MSHAKPARMFALIVAAFVAIGCASTPRQKLEQAEHVQAGALSGVDAAVDAKIIRTRAQADVISAAIRESEAAIADASARILSGEPLEVDFYVSRAASAAARFAEMLAKLKENPR